jgi:hypothetical protein
MDLDADAALSTRDSEVAQPSEPVGPTTRAGPAAGRINRNSERTETSPSPSSHEPKLHCQLSTGRQVPEVNFALLVPCVGVIIVMAMFLLRMLGGLVKVLVTLLR